MSEDIEIQYGVEQQPKPNQNESREISILKRNLRLLRRIVLGKKKPPLFLMILSYVFMGWSLLIGLYFTIIGFSITIGINDDQVKDLRFMYSYALLHFIAVVGCILMYRRKIAGFYLFSTVTLLMPFWYMITGGEVENRFDIYVLIFSIISIGLFAINWNKFTANIKKSIEKKKSQL